MEAIIEYNQVQVEPLKRVREWTEKVAFIRVCQYKKVIFVQCENEWIEIDLENKQFSLNVHSIPKSTYKAPIWAPDCFLCLSDMEIDVNSENAAWICKNPKCPNDDRGVIEEG